MKDNVKLKMKFYGSGIVWDKENNQRLCKFKNGEFETDDERVATILHNLGYRSESNGWKTFERDAEGPAPEEEPETNQPEEKAIRAADLEPLNIKELRDLAKGRGLTGYYRLSKAELIDTLIAVNQAKE